MSSPQSVTRVIHILEALSASAEPITLAELSRSLKTPKSSLAALLRGLADADFVVVSEGAYRLGPGAFGLGSLLLEARRRVHASDLIRDGMRKLADRSEETVVFAVNDEDGLTSTYVDVVESRNTVRFAVSVGDRRPLYCTAGGRILLAMEPEAVLAQYLERLKPERLAPQTEINKRRLADAIASARLHGVSQTVDQSAEGVSGTAAPIFDASGAVLGALVLAAPSLRAQGRSAELADMVRQQAAAISRSLGYRPPPA